MKKSLTPVVVALVVGLVTPVIPQEIHFKPRVNHIRALKIRSYYQRIDKKTPKLEVVEKTLDAIDENLPKYFPNGPFENKDFIAMAMLESDFHQYEVGTSGERGIFQIMKHNVKGHKSWEHIYDVNFNTKMAMKVLHWKYQERGEYKMSIIAYNGVVRHKGKVSEKYYRAFLKNKNIVETCLGHE